MSWGRFCPIGDARPTTTLPNSTLTLPTKAIVALSAVKVLGAIGMVAVRSESPALASTQIPLAFVILQLLAFGGTGAILLLANARDERTTHLGTVLLLISSSFATSHFRDLADVIRPAALVAALYPDAFLGYYLAQFVARFPQRSSTSWSAHVIRHLRSFSCWSGWLLFVANAAVGWQLVSADAGWMRILLRRSAGGTVYWTITFVIVLCLLALTIVGTRQLVTDEGRRVRLFWGAFILALAPVTVIVILGAIPGYGPEITAWALSRWPMFGVHLALAMTPLVVTYAVLVRRMLPLRVVVRQAVGYLLARSVVTAAFLVPLGILIAHGYTHRHQTISVALSGHMGRLLAIAALAGIALLLREEGLRLVDRLFFREEYDAREILVRLTAESRRVHRVDELAALVTAGIDRALRPESLAVLVRDRPSRHFVSPFGSVEPLPCSSVLAEILSASSEPIDVALDPAGALRWLPRAERQWLVDSQSRLLVPLRASDGGIMGFVSLGERKSELPFSHEDRRLLQAIAEASALTIENHSARVDTSDADDWWNVGTGTHANACECEACGRIQAQAASCLTCGGTVSTAQVPRLMFGKFQFERRVGQGAMGIVYQVTDLSLDRTVAIKTLPGTSPEHSQRLRLEAKAMAAVTHPNLATIHGAESWRGRPMLVCEYMTHGTLAARLAQGALAIEEALTLCLALADALRVIHSAGLLHRDIKPSNIGFGHDGAPKLLDFGLVHMLTAGGVRPTEDHTRQSADPLTSLTLTNAVVGTPLYLCPEAVRGELPTTAFDLWSLNVLLLEATTGRHPFRGRTVHETLHRVCEDDAAVILRDLRLTSPALSTHLERALAKDPTARPRSAAQLVDALRAVVRSVRGS